MAASEGAQVAVVSMAAPAVAASVVAASPVVVSAAAGSPEVVSAVADSTADFEDSTDSVAAGSDFAVDSDLASADSGPAIMAGTGPDIMATIIHTHTVTRIIRIHTTVTATDMGRWVITAMAALRLASALDSAAALQTADGIGSPAGVDGSTADLMLP